DVERAGIYRRGGSINSSFIASSCSSQVAIGNQRLCAHVIDERVRRKFEGGVVGGKLGGIKCRRARTFCTGELQRLKVLQQAVQDDEIVRATGTGTAKRNGVNAFATVHDVCRG